jgi:hypothetical protein
MMLCFVLFYGMGKRCLCRQKRDAKSEVVSVSVPSTG